jgi:hypothetical protein
VAAEVPGAVQPTAIGEESAGVVANIPAMEIHPVMLHQQIALINVISVTMTVTLNVARIQSASPLVIEHWMTN